MKDQQPPCHLILVATQAAEAVEAGQPRAEQNQLCSHLHQTASAVEAEVVEVLYDLIRVLLAVDRVEVEVAEVSLALLSH